MRRTGHIFALQLDNRELVLDFEDGEINLYRIRAGELEFRTSRWDRDTWHQLTPEEILQHLMLQTPVGTWLKLRMQPVAGYQHAA